MNRRIFAIVWAVIFTSLAIHAPVSAQKADKAKTIAPEKAIDHVGKTVTIEMTVHSGKKVDNSERYFLDSEKDYKSPTNLAVVIPYDSATAFEKAGVKDIMEHYLDKKVRVTGKVIRNADQTRIFVTDPKKLVVIEAEPAGKK